MSRSEAYAHMSKLAWRAIDARHKYGLKSPEYSEAHNAAQEAKIVYLQVGTENIKPR